ncbi:hypothetical protein Tco_1499294 [Tanacetum coccineum]
MQARIRRIFHDGYGVLRDDGILNIEKSSLPTLDTGDDFQKQMRNVFLRPLGEGQPFTTSTQIKEPPEELDGGLTTISFAHNNKGSQFGITKRVKPRYMNLNILKNFTEKLSERQSEIYERKRMSVQSDISRRSIENSLVGFRKNNMLEGLPFELKRDLLPNCTIRSSNSFEWRKIISGMITSMGIRHAKTLTLRGEAFDETRAKVRLVQVNHPQSPSL